MASVSDKYRKLDQREHVLARPAMYIGSVEKDQCETWAWDAAAGRITKQQLVYVPGLYKIFDEILVNAIDHATRMAGIIGAAGAACEHKPVKNIKVKIDQGSGYIEVWNDGDGIDVEVHPEHNVYVPELIFGHMLTGSNYDDAQERIIGGQNGIGAKACNIFSKEFTVTTVDHGRNKMYVQTFRDNMTIAEAPTITPCKRVPFTCIRFLPDYERFGLSGLGPDMYALLVKRVHDACAVTDASVTVWLNDDKLACKSFERYVDLYVGAKGDRERFFERSENGRWEVVVACSDSGFEHVSFVNGIATFKGGKHVDNVSAAIVKRVCDMILEKKKQAVKPQHVRESLMLFIKSTIDSPSFDSQSKECLTTPASKFGSRCDLSDKFFDKLYKSEIVARVMTRLVEQEAKDAKKTDGKKSNRIKGMHKLEDANMAGSSRSRDCALILTEGESAKGLAVSGLEVVGRDKFGVFPLRGKMLNVKDAPAKKVLENEEVQNLKKILGLEAGKTYDSLDALRYGKIVLMTDADVDGSHCKGLIMNVFHTLWPSLMNQPGFVTSLLTPIIKATRGEEQVSFYNQQEFEAWKQAHDGGHGYAIKYYKGLGTSTDEEAKEYFRDMRLVRYDFDGQPSNNSLDLVFNKKRADDRKRWLGEYDPESTIKLDNQAGEQPVSYQDFVNRDLIHFSVYDVKRSIPNVVDGLKPSQRKILFACLKRNLTSEIKVAQLAGYVSETAAYHHGEASLQGAIVCMAQDFVGSNNMNLLRPNGNFGSRRLGGKDAASPRYIFTQLDNMTPKVFRKEDSPLLKYLNDDGYMVEPEFYVPVLPMVLVNGACGIGTGFSTSIPSYNPLDVIKALRALIETDGGGGDAVAPLIPWYRGFKGSVLPNGDRGFVTRGVFALSPDGKSVEITELPIGVWSEDYKAFLEDYSERNPKVLRDYETHYNNNVVRFVLHFHPEELKRLLDAGEFDKEFRITGGCLNTTNMHLFDERGVIKKYGSVQDIISDFYSVRMRAYEARKAAEIARLEGEKARLSARAKFIADACAGAIAVMNVSRKQLEQRLDELDFARIDGSFAHLTSMPIHSLTHEKREELERDVGELEAGLGRYMDMPIKDLWLQELAEVEAEYTKSLDAYAKKQSNAVTNKGKVGGAGTAGRPGQANGGSKKKARKA